MLRDAMTHYVLSLCRHTTGNTGRRQPPFSCRIFGFSKAALANLLISLIFGISESGMFHCSSVRSTAEVNFLLTFKPPQIVLLLSPVLLPGWWRRHEEQIRY